MDVCLSKDNKIIVVHDKDLKRLCGINKKVYDCSYDELPLIQDRFTIHFHDKELDSSSMPDHKLALFEDV